MRINYKTQIRAEIRKAGQMNAAEGKMAGKAERMAETSHEGNTREHVTKCTYEYGDKARWGYWWSETGEVSYMCRVGRLIYVVTVFALAEIRKV